MPWTVLVTDSTTGSETTARVSLTLLDDAVAGVRRWRRFDPELHGGARQALDQRGGGFDGEAFELAPADRHDQLAGLQPRASRRRGVEHPLDQQTAVVGGWVATDTPMPVKCGGETNSRYSLGVR